MTLTFSGPEHWLTYITRQLAPFERKKAQAPFRADVACWRGEGLNDAEIEIVARLRTRSGRCFRPRVWRCLSCW